MVKRSLPDEVKTKINRVLRKSVEFAFANRKASLPYVREHAQEMSEEVMYKHIDLYVNNFSIDLGKEGIKGTQKAEGRIEFAVFVLTTNSQTLEPSVAPNIPAPALN